VRLHDMAWRRTSLQDPTGATERSVSQYDIPHVFQFSYVYQFPFGRGKRWAATCTVYDTVLADGRSNGIGRFDNGMPRRFVSNRGRFPTYGSQRPNQLPRSHETTARLLDQYFAQPLNP